VAQVAVCSQINTKHKNTVWAEGTVVENTKLTQSKQNEREGKKFPPMPRLISRK